MAADAAKAPREKPPRTKPKILIVDDDDAFCRLLKDRLSDTYDVVEAANSERALEMVLQDRPDCILLDLMMPRHSGLELCQTLASLSFTQLIPIIIMTGQSAASYKEFSLNLGARDFFEKPLDFQRLKVRLAEILQATTEERRVEARIRMRTDLVLRGIDKRGDYFEARTSTENVSATGFACTAAVPLEKGTVVELELLPDTERLGGRAKVVRVIQNAKGVTIYGFRITEKYSKWTLK